MPYNVDKEQLEREWQARSAKDHRGDQERVITDLTISNHRIVP
jgi:hypothetical protein